MLEKTRLPYEVPYYAQIASRELAGRIFNEGFPPEKDPNWYESGAETPQEYAYWVERACGIACVKMCVEALGGPERSMMQWVGMGLAKGGYLITEQDGKVVERGWVHRILAELIMEEGYHAEAKAASPEDIAAFLRGNELVIASVSYQLGTTHPITLKGGHLVVVTGADLQHGSPTMFYINNPSGRTASLQENAPIPANRFADSFTGRVITAGRLK
jgi:hypothetical protein